MDGGVYFYYGDPELDEEQELRMSYGWHLSPADIVDLLHHHCWQAVRGGHAAAFQRRRFPGSDIHRLANDLIASGIVTVEEGRYRTTPGLSMLHFNGPTSWAARWRDGSVTVAPRHTGGNAAVTRRG